MTSPALAFIGLPETWRNWVTENIERKSEPIDIAQQLISKGQFSARTAYRAVYHAMQVHRSSPQDFPYVPNIDCTGNIVLAGDREVTILAALKEPRVVVLGGLLSDEECEALIIHGVDRLTPSTVVSDDGGGNTGHPNRTSRGVILQRGEVELVSQIEARIAALTHWPVERGEGLQLLYYGPGNRYEPHQDWFNPATPGGLTHLARGGQRVATLIMYLNDVEQGGCTIFPSLGLQVAPKKGNAVFFVNADGYSQPDPAVLHGGEPVVAGHKYAATKWLRMRETS